MKKPILLFILIFFASFLSAQDSTKWIIRVGAAGTGTFDEGIWTFNQQSGLGTQAFLFENSWGGVLSVNYKINRRLMAGIYTSASLTDFHLTIEDGNTNTIEARDFTSLTPVLLEANYQFFPEKRANLLLGLCAGIMFTRDISLEINPNVRPVDFIFENPFIYGFTVGTDVSIGKKGWFLHTQIKSLTFEYTLKENSWVDRQTLLDQIFWMNYNHVVIGMGKRI